MKSTKKILVAMSGGVDSSVAAALLKDKGFDVVGATLQIWPKEECHNSRSRVCCSLQDIQDARGVSNKIGIPFYVLNFIDEFRSQVIDYFILSYLSGCTPNPCVVCNEKIKFGILLKKALSLGMDHIATGHYAKLTQDRHSKRFLLQEADDKEKDQSYFLFSLKQSQLKNIIFPVGNFKKGEVRNIAKKFKLTVHDKPASQDICFVQDKDYARYIEKKMAILPKGPIVDTKGKQIGSHKGIFHYTIGQRKGLGIADKRPLYVIEIDPEGNRLTVGYEEETKKDFLLADRVNWIWSRQKIKLPFRCKAKIRYNNPKSDCTILDIKNDTVFVRFKDKQNAITPGQAVVFYKDDYVVGGGWIIKN